MHRSERRMSLSVTALIVGIVAAGAGVFALYQGPLSPVSQVKNGASGVNPITDNVWEKETITNSRIPLSFYGEEFYREETDEKYMEDFKLVKGPYHPKNWPDWAPNLLRGSYEDGNIVAKGEKYPVWVGEFRVKENTTTARYVKGSLENAWMRGLVIENVYRLSKFKPDTFYIPHPGPAPKPGENVTHKPLDLAGRSLNLEVSKYLFMPEETTKPPLSPY